MKRIDTSFGLELLKTRTLRSELKEIPAFNPACVSMLLSRRNGIRDGNQWLADAPL
ncbi:MAG TPA: hypothetical protein VF599_16765 [Pyrinomonadaceae bacterium]|jgi:hypothetical protein